MKRDRLRRHNSFWVVPFLFVLVMIGGIVEARAVTLYSVSTSNQLLRFDSASPGTVTTVGAITGLQASENVVGIDFRPANGKLYGLGSMSRLYTIDTTTGAASQVGTAGAFTLSGTLFDIDFNPVVDRIRIVSNTGQNIRINPNDGTLSGTDTTLNPGTPGVAAAAYDFDLVGTTTTTLYTIDTTADTINIQGGVSGSPSPNGGTQSPTFNLGFDAIGANGFDITNGSSLAFAALQVAGDTTSKLFRMNLISGTTTLVGVIGVAAPVRSLAAVPGSAASSAVNFDGDFRSDFANFRPSTDIWMINQSSTNTVASTGFGLAEVDALEPQDYDGDGKTDIAVWRTTNGFFYVLRSSDNTVQYVKFGVPGDEPIPRDYDGDRKADFAVIRRSGGQCIWYILNSSTGALRSEQFGLASDYSAPGDYDGDGKFDLGVRRGTGSQQATYYVQRSRDGFQAVQFGIGSDLIVPGDYDGDGRTDFTALRQGSAYTWFILQSSNGSVAGPVLGTTPQYAAQGDYDGDGKTDVTVWDPASGTYSYLRSSTGSIVNFQFGQNGDVPVASFDTH